MPFAYRAHAAFVNLDPGELMHFDLPPTTAGVILIRGTFYPGSGTDFPGDHSGGGTIPGPVPRMDWNRLGNLEELRGDGLEVGRRATIARRPAEGLDANVLEPEIGGGSRPAGELVFELFYGDQVAQQKEDGHPIFYETASSAASWSLRITRKLDTSTDRRRFRIDAIYPSVLPLLDRRIPMSTLRRGFEQNWNDGHQYVEELWIENNIVNWRFDKKVSTLYDLPLDLDREGSHDLGGSTLAAIPFISKQSIQFGVGYEDGLIIPPATSATKIPYLSLTLNLACRDSREIDVLGPDNVTLPQNFSVEVRLELRHTQGIMIYNPRVMLSQHIEDSVSGFDLDIPGKLRGLERTLFKLQWAEGYNRFDRVMRPWFVGHYEVVDVEYDQSTDDIVIWHVGRPIALEMVTAPDGGAGGGGGWDDLPSLFAEADDEKWLSSVPEVPLRLPPRSTPGALEKIDHIVVLMQENRSFDQVFGYLSRDAGDAGVEGLLPGANARDVNEYRRDSENAPRQYRSTLSSDTSWPFALNNPCHSHDCVTGQISGGMKSFVADYARRLGANAPVKDLQRIMDYHGATELPVFAELARQFAICDHWFASHIGGTLPNRHVTFTGDLNRDRHDLPEEDNSDFMGYAPSERLTFFDHLTARGISWKLFEHGYNMLRLYRKYTFDNTNIVGFNDEQLGFEKLAREGALPSVSFIEPDYIEEPSSSNDDHAPADMHNGQILVARIVRAMMGNSDQWAKSMLIITYDEHGGYYDHLIPPDEVEVTSNGGVTMREIPPLSNSIRQLGPRVPAIVVSPLIDPGVSGVNVSKTVYEHTTIAATILRRFCSPRPPQMSGRVTAANDLRELLTRDSARPQTDFADTLAIMDAVASSPVRQSPGAEHSPVPIRKLDASADLEDFKQDFHGFIAYASAVTGRSESAGRIEPVVPVAPQPGQLLFYRDSTQNGTGDVSSPAVIGLGGWQAFKFLFSGGNGIIYAVPG
ncbi:MAG TPA: alkaline phosphatase family protein [Gaiellaceae bacterium]|nr:alkaline phosphatase family protein [Gaiellaceae bacterium]